MHPTGIPEEPASAPRRTRFEEFWRLFRKNRLALVGLAVFLLFFATAVAGVFLTAGHRPVFDPALVRLQEKLRPPLSPPLWRPCAPDRGPRRSGSTSSAPMTSAGTSLPACFRAPGSP
ncbi:MAG: hypothetical protein U5R30_01850 [Deltaproteobacteria bacterium]|nr:hypothetical protein [Deltaproteobacteria bacterium]